MNAVRILIKGILLYKIAFWCEHLYSSFKFVLAPEWDNVRILAVSIGYSSISNVYLCHVILFLPKYRNPNIYSTDVTKSEYINWYEYTNTDMNRKDFFFRKLAGSQAIWLRLKVSSGILHNVAKKKKSRTFWCRPTSGEACWTKILCLFV